MPKLSNERIKSIKKEGRHGDGGCLYLNVAKGGTKSFVLSIQIKGGQRRNYGLGGVGYTSLSEARKKAVEYRQAARVGIDPRPPALIKQSDMPTFEQATTDTLESMRPEWSARKSKEWIREMNRLVMPRLGNIPVDAIRRAHIIHILQGLWDDEKFETAKKLKTAIKQVFEWCIEIEIIQDNPAVGIRPRKSPEGEENLRSMEYGEVGEALKMIEKSKHRKAAECLEFLILTGARSERGRAARWDEISLDDATWTLPASKMKNGKPFRQPLSDQAVRLLESLAVDSESEWVFPASRGGSYMSDKTMRLLLEETGLMEKTCIHGFRATLRTWGREHLKANEDVLELILSHTLSDALIRRYQRSDLFDERKELLEAWAIYIAGK